LASFNTAEESSQVSLTVSDQNPEILALAVHTVHNIASNPAEPSSGEINHKNSTSDLRPTNQFNVPNINQCLESGFNNHGSADTPKLVISIP